MKKIFTIVLALTLLTIFAVMMSACGSSAVATNNNPNSPTVSMDLTNFSQSSITIKKGQSLTLSNDSAAVHIIENGTWDNNGTPKADIEPGAVKVDATFNGGDSHTYGPFTTAGTFQLYCTIHPGMNLTIIVK